jgi:hypothetical protein
MPGEPPDSIPGAREGDSYRDGAELDPLPLRFAPPGMTVERVEAGYDGAAISGRHSP